MIIMTATMTHHLDTGSNTASVTFLDRRHRPHERHGGAQQAYMVTLLLEAIRQGITVCREEF